MIKNHCLDMVKRYDNIYSIIYYWFTYVSTQETILQNFLENILRSTTCIVMDVAYLTLYSMIYTILYVLIFLTPLTTGNTLVCGWCFEPVDDITPYSTEETFSCNSEVMRLKNEFVLIGHTHTNNHMKKKSIIILSIN